MVFYKYIYIFLRLNTLFKRKRNKVQVKNSFNLTDKPQCQNEPEPEGCELQSEVVFMTWRPDMLWRSLWFYTIQESLCRSLSLAQTRTCTNLQGCNFLFQCSPHQNVFVPSPCVLQHIVSLRLFLNRAQHRLQKHCWWPGPRMTVCSHWIKTEECL